MLAITGVTISPTSVDEGTAAGAVSTFSCAGASAAVTLTFVSGTGDTNNGDFTISSTSL